SSGSWSTTSRRRPCAWSRRPVRRTASTRFPVSSPRWSRWKPPPPGPGAACERAASNLVGMTDVRAELLQQIKDKAVVHGRGTLSSGLEADYYVDLRRVPLDGTAAPLVGQVLLDLTDGLEYDAVGGLTMGADPVAGAMLHAAAARGRHLDAFVVRKAAK